MGAGKMKSRILSKDSTANYKVPGLRYRDQPSGVLTINPYLSDLVNLVIDQQ